MKSNTTKIFFSPNRSYKRELAFFDNLLRSNSDLVHLKEKYLLPKSFINHFLNRNEILRAINADLLLPAQSKLICREVVSKFPEQFAIINNISKISVDFVIQKGNDVYFIEFHEQQHRRLTKKKEYSIYTTSFEQIRVPRFVQRLLKDIWRWKYLENYQIVWWDWFEANPEENFDLFTRGKKELFIPGKFSFSGFLETNFGFDTA